MLSGWEEARKQEKSNSSVGKAFFDSTLMNLVARWVEAGLNKEETVRIVMQPDEM